MEKNQPLSLNEASVVSDYLRGIGKVVQHKRAVWKWTPERVAKTYGVTVEEILNAAGRPVDKKGE